MNTTSKTEYLSDLEKSKIAIFNKDAILVNAIRKVLLASIYDNGTLRAGLAPNPLKNAALALVANTQNGVISNADLGEDLRGLFHGISFLEKGLMELAKIKNEEPPNDGDSLNQAV